MTEFVFRPVYLLKFLVLTLLCSQIMIVTFYLVVSKSIIINIVIWMPIIAIGIVFGFYLNRFELKSITVFNNNMKVDFVNKSFFARNSATIEYEELSMIKSKNQIQLFHRGKLLGIIRINSINDDKLVELERKLTTLNV